MIGRPLQQALSSINGANLRLLYLRFPVTSRSQAGKIVQQSPLAGAQAPRNAQVVGLPRRVLGLSSNRGAPTRGYQPRRSSSSLGSSDCVEMPTIASPRPAETRATTSASR